MGFFSDSTKDIESQIEYAKKNIERYKKEGRKLELNSEKEKVAKLKIKLADAKKKAKK
jgi:hypothetical protein